MFLSFLTGPITAASEPGEKEGRETLESLWADLYKDEPFGSSAVLKLFMQPDKAVPLLKAKLLPLKLDAARCMQLIKDLGSDDESVWRVAWEELDYLDPRLAIDLQTLMNDVTETRARTRLVELCSQMPADSLAGEDLKIRSVRDGFNFAAGGRSWWAEHQIVRVGNSSWNRKHSWVRAVRGVAILEQIGSAEAIKVLEQMEHGHPDAFPTRAAKESLTRLKR